MNICKKNFLACIFLREIKFWELYYQEKPRLAIIIVVNGFFLLALFLMLAAIYHLFPSYLSYFTLSKTSSTQKVCREITVAIFREINKNHISDFTTFPLAIHDNFHFYVVDFTKFLCN